MNNNLWKQQLIAGNDCFQSQQWQRSEHFYTLAFNTLQQHCSTSNADSELLLAWVCTCHNLCSLFEAQKMYHKAYAYLQCAHEHCRYLASSERQESPSPVALKALSLTRPALFSFQKRYPQFTTQPSDNKSIVVH